ncbi:putative ribonuclease H-like domain-containing protein [Tanacetum coccineum]|uniref:Ribonuclease H-like domain-containing protein n=1 Tax=Tanacetum coccineum TaxID=301880 RepID=A0ABQ5CAB6_9ASTR
MEKYLTHTDYALWEVIMIGDAPAAVASASIGAEGHIPPKTAKQMLARKNELKAKSTLMLAIPNEHLLKFHACKDAKSLWEAIKNSQEGLDKIYDRFQKLISQLEIHDNSSSTNETVNTAHSISAASSKDQASTASYADDIDANDLKEMDLKWQMAMLIMRVKRFIKKTGRKMDLNDKETVSFDMTKVECYNCHSRCHFTKECKALRNQGNRNRDAPRRNTPVDTSTTNALVVQDGIGSSSSSSSDSELKEALIEKDDLKLKLEKFEESSKNLTKLINSQISAKDESELNNIHMNESEVVHSVFNSREGDVDDNPINDRLKTGEGFHVVPPPYTRNYMPPRPDLSFVGLDEFVFKSAVRKTTTSVPETETSISKTSKDIVEKPKTVRPSALIIEEWDTDNDNDNVFRPKSDQTKPKFTKINFVKSAVATKSGQVPVNAAKQSSPRAAVSISTARPVNTDAPNQKVNKVTTAGPKVVVSAAVGNGENVVKSSACWIWRPTGIVIDHNSKDSGSYMLKRFDYGNPQYTLQDQGIFDSGCSRHMTGNKSFLTDYQEIDGGFVAFGGSPKGGKITRKGKIRTGKLDFEDVYFVKKLKFNLFSISQMCDKKNNVLFTETECLVLSPDFKLLDESQVLLKVPRQNNMYSFDLKNVVPSGGLTCLFANATIDESNLWHRRLGHINFKTMNKLVRGNLDETSGILKTFITGIENQINHKVKIIRCDNGTEFKNNDMNQFCGMKGIKREFSVARTPQQNGVAKRKNKTLIEAARTMLADSLLPTIFWAEAVNTACYVQNRVLVTKPHNKTPYELLHGRPPSISFMRPFGCPMTILNTLDPLGKFDGKADEGFLVGYSINSKALWVFNTRTRKVEENLHITFLENKPNVVGSKPDWLFDIDLLTNSINYKPVTVGNQTNKNAGIKDNVDAVPTQQYILLPLLYDSPQSSEDAVADDAGKKTNEEPANEGERNGQEKEGGASNKEDDQNVQDFRAELDNLLVQQKEGYANSTNRVSTVSPSVSAAGQSFDNADDLPTDPLMPDLEDTADLLNTGIFSGAYDDEDEGAEADLNNLETTMNVSPIPTTRIHKDHPKDQIIRDINSATQTRRMTKISEEHALVSYINKQRRTNHKDYQNCLFAYFLSQKEPKKVIQALDDPSWIEAMQEELLQFKLQKMDVKNAFLYGTIEEEVAWYETLSTYLLENGFRRGTIDKTLFIKKDKGLQVKQKDDGIFISQDKYVADILKKFDFATVKTASTPIETNKALLKDEEAEDVDVHLYRSMIGSLMYLTASRPDIMFAVCACARFQVTPKVSHLHAVKRIFRYLKGQPKLGLWYPRDSPFDLEAFSDSDYARASLDRKSTTGGCQFLGKRLISWQCKKHTIVANSTTEAEYVADANCCGQVLWIQNQMLDYGFNFMNTKIHIDNESTICIVKNLVFHAKTKHIEIRHHFIRDSYEKRLIQVIKIHTDHNVADLLTKAFDVSSISNEFGVKTGGCKVNAARQDLVLLGKNLKFVDQHNMVACLEKSEGNADFHEIVDFLTASSVYYALTQIHATVEGKTVVILESSVRSDLHFNDEDGVTQIGSVILILLINFYKFEPVTTRNQANRNAGIKDNVITIPTQQYIMLPFLPDSPQSSDDAVANDVGEASNKEGGQYVQDLRAELDKLLVQQKEDYANNTNRVSTFSPSVSAAGQSFVNDLLTDPLIPDLEDTTDI